MREWEQQRAGKIDWPDETGGKERVVLGVIEMEWRTKERKIP